jgi:hypothetical protein
MSVRPKDAFEAAQSFSLRAVLSRQEPATPAVPANASTGLTFNLASIKRDGQPEAPPQLPPQLQKVQQLPRGMSFKLNFSEKQQQPRAFVEQPEQMPALTFSNMRGNPFAAQKAEMISKEQANTKADVMRLTAYVDELTGRLKKTQSRLEQTEFQLTRTSQVLCKERQAADQTLAAYKQDLALAHENEEKLRAEITANKKKTALQETTFMSSVGVALASDEQLRQQQRNLDELETKVKALGEFKIALEAEVAKLTSLRDSAKKSFDEVKTSHSLETTRVESISAEISVASKELDATKAENAALLSQMANVKIEEATVKEGVEALKTKRVRAEEETAAAKSALQAMLLEHGEVARKLSWQQNKLSELETKQAAAMESLAQAEEKLAEVSRLLPVEQPAEQPAEPTSASTSSEQAASAPVLAPVPEEEAPSVPPFALETGCCPRCAEQEGAASEYESEAYESDDEPIAPPLAPKLAPKRKGRVTGAVAPNRALCTNFQLPVPHMERSHVAAVAAIDAPLDMTLRRVSFVGSEHALLETSAIAREEDTGASNAQEEMINAVVTDLKEKLTEISTSQPAYRLVAPLV